MAGGGEAGRSLLKGRWRLEKTTVLYAHDQHELRRFVSRGLVSCLAVIDSAAHRR